MSRGVWPGGRIVGLMVGARVGAGGRPGVPERDDWRNGWKRDNGDCPRCHVFQGFRDNGDCPRCHAWSSGEVAAVVPPDGECGGDEGEGEAQEDGAYGGGLAGEDLGGVGVGVGAQENVVFYGGDYPADEVEDIADQGNADAKAHAVPAGQGGDGEADACQLKIHQHLTKQEGQEL